MDEHSPHIPEDLTPWGLPGLSKEDLLVSLSGLRSLISAFKAKSPQAESLVKLAATPFTNILTQQAASIPQNPQAMVQGIVTQIQGLYSLFTGSIVLQGGSEFKGASRKMLEEIANMSGQLRGAEKQYNDIIQWHADTEIHAHNAAERAEQIQKLETKAEGIGESLQEHETDAAAAMTAIADFQKNAKATTKSLEDVHTDAVDLRGKLEEMLSLTKKQQDRIQSNLEDSSRVGMASSFNKRKQDLLWQVWIWGILLVASLGGLVAVGIKFLLPEVSDAHPDWVLFLLKLPITGPFIWLAWFAGAQYRSTSSVREDYAFKNAAAMAFEGYRRETAAIDEDLLKELLQRSIETFSQNPLRLFENQKAKETPAAEALESIKSLVESVADIAKKIKP